MPPASRGWPEKGGAAVKRNEGRGTRRSGRGRLRLRRRTWALGAAALLLLAGAGGYLWLFAGLPDVGALPGPGPFQSSRILDRNGHVLYDLVDPERGQRTVLPLDAIPLAMRQATISTEDSGFYQHPGVDPGAVARALWTSLTGGEPPAGASTITQQLARAALLSPDEAAQRSLRRKAREAVLALEIDRRYSKDTILGLYLNTIYYGNMAYGVEAAAQAYFGKSARDLDLAEAALLAGLPQAPSRYDPLTDPAAAKARQQQVLDLLVKHGSLTQEAAATAAAEPLHYTTRRFPISAPHFVMYVRDLLEQRFGRQRVYAGGLTVETTLDSGMQAAAEDVLQRRLATLAPQHVSNGAVVILDAATGAVRALVGSVDYFDAAIDGQVNLALAPRQPGSALKPLTYGVALSRDFTAATVLPDIPTTYADDNGQSYVPVDYDHRFHGPQRLRLALANSYNVPAVYTLNHIGVYGLVQAGRAAGFTTWADSSRFGLALTLGGGEVRLLELTGAYDALANGGQVRLPFAITRVTDSQGHVLYDAATDPAVQQPGPPLFGAQSPGIAWILDDILADDDARLPAFGPNSPLQLSRPAAVKTGTTADWRDNWTIGLTPDFVTGVWVGNNDNSPMQESTGVTGAAPIWHDVMERIHQGRPVRWFARPPALQQVTICANSGLLPTAACPDRVPEWFLPGTAPTALDTWHQNVAVDNAGGLLACPGAPAGTYTTRSFLLLPPEYTAWAAQAGLPAPPTAYAPGCGTAAGGGAAPGDVDLAITSPAANGVAGGTVAVEGRADGADLAGWSLDWGEGATPQAWQPIAAGSAAPGTRVLGHWDTAARGGVHTLRLRGHLRDGTTLDVTTRVNLDNIAPTVWISYPTAGSTFAGLQPGERFPFQAEAQDNTGVAAVLFYADGRLLDRLSAAPWAITVDPATLGPSTHRLRVVAVDLAGNRSPPAEIALGSGP